MKTDFENFRDWLPARVYRHENQLMVDWCYLGKERLTEPFFDDSVQKSFRNPFSLLFRHQTPIEFLGELNEEIQGLRPNGFIFHLSRCGSTLVSQMLAALEETIVLSEPPLIDAVLRANFESLEVSDEQRINWLQWTVNALGQKRNPQERYFFIKFDSWSTLDLDLIRRAFPQVPWIFLYRNPIEIIVSQMRQSGAQMIPGIIGQTLSGIELTEALKLPREEYCARVLAQITESALENLPAPEGLPVNYLQLPEAATSTILKHFGVDFNSEKIERMRHAARFDAKTPQMNFVADTAAKQSEASKPARQAAEKWVDPLYRRLEKIRARPSGN